MRSKRASMSVSVRTRSLAVPVLIVLLTTSVFGQSTQTIDVPAPAGGVDVPAWTRTVLPNGLVVILMKQDENPLVHARLTLRAGSSSDPKGKEGLASLTAELLTAGTAKRSAEQIATDTDFVGGQLSATSDAETTTVTSQFLSRDTARQFDLLSDVVLRPAFAAAEVDRVRQQRLGEIAALPENSGRYADIQYESVLMAGTPYAHPSVGLKSSVSTITRDDVVAFHTAAYVPNNGVLAIVGAFDPAAMMKMVESSFGAWAKRAVTPPSASAPGRIAGRRVVVVDYPNLNQAQVRIGDIGIARSDPDYAAIQVANAVLSFGFSSRLTEEIRVNRSLTYRIASRFSAGVNPGTFAITTFTKNSTTREIIDATLAEVKKFRDGPLTDAEVNRAKNIILARLTQQLETPSGLAGMLTQIEIFGLPKDYVETLGPSIRGITPASLQPIVRKNFPLDDIVIVVFTTASETKPQLEGLAPIEVRKAE